MDRARSAVLTPFLLINIFSFLLCFFSPLQQGNPHFLIEVVGEWILGSAERERGTTRCPCWQRCIKMGMSHPICRAHLPASKGGSSIPPFFSLQCSEVSPSLARLLLLKARLALNGGEGSTDSAIPAGDGKRSETECLNNLGYLYEHYLWNISAFFFLPLYIWDEIIYFYFISLALCILHRALFRRLIRFPENQLWICFVSSVVDWCF